MQIAISQSDANNILDLIEALMMAASRNVGIALMPGTLLL
jgi:hypothetical protein